MSLELHEYEPFWYGPDDKSCKVCGKNEKDELHVPDDLTNRFKLVMEEVTADERRAREALLREAEAKRKAQEDELKRVEKEKQSRKIEKVEKAIEHEMTEQFLSEKYWCPCNADTDDCCETGSRRAALKAFGVTAEDFRVYRRRTGDKVLFRTPGGMVICKTHLLECSAYLFYKKPLQVRVIGPRERMYSGYISPCALCEAVVSRGNKCENCETALHPQWPAVYCSDECALDDRY